MRSAPAVLGILLVATMASAGDGVLEINQTCAVQTGCFEGDAAGFPVTISTPGSYRLTSNVSTASPDPITAISINASDVVFDLNGFSIIDANASAFSTGIGGSADRITVSGGVVKDYTRGVSLTGSSVVLHDMRIPARSLGVELGSNCQLLRSTITTTEFANPVRLGESCLMDGNRAGTTAQNGVAASVGQLSTVTNNHFYAIDGGIVATNSVVRNNTIRIFWLGTGISSSGGVVAENVVSAPGSTFGISASNAIISKNRVSANTAIACSDCLVTENVTSGSVGLDASGGGGTTGYQGNQFNGTAALQVIGGIETGPNICGGDLTCP